MIALWFLAFVLGGVLAARAWPDVRMPIVTAPFVGFTAAVLVIDDGSPRPWLVVLAAMLAVAAFQAAFMLTLNAMEPK
jgi:hypothetical protein